MGIHANVPLPVRTHANEVARGLGITLGRYLEILIARDIMDETGKPAWAKSDLDLIQTIPMPSSAEGRAA